MNSSQVAPPKSDGPISAADTVPPQADELIGRTLNGSYVIEEVLGEGGVGRVYRARHARINTKLFALKVLHAEHSRDPQQLARFQREAEAAASLSHPNVVGVFDIGRTDDGYSYLACELLRGIDLDEYLEEQGPLKVEAVVHVGLQICAALESAHEQNIIHRDLKPQNVFLMHEADGKVAELPTVKLVDFGLSRMLDHGDSQLTKTGTLMGTPAFMAPEQATGDRGDHRVDVYGLGVILYVALTGRAPFLEETLPAMLVAVMTEDPPRPSKLVAQVPEALELIIQKAMAKQADERYRSIAAMREALEGVLSPSREVTPSLHRTRFRMSSVQLAEETAYELKTSRARLIFFGAVAIALALACLTAGVSGLELFTGPLSFTRTELLLVALGIFGTIATPATLLFRHLRRSVWSNSAKVVDALTRLRGPVTTALVAYGASVVIIRLGDDFLSRLGQNELFNRFPGIAWPGFTWMLPLGALLAGGLSFLKVRLNDGDISPRRRLLLGAPLRLLSMLLVAGVIYGALVWRRVDLRAQREAAAKIAANTPDAPSQAPLPYAVQAPTPPPPPITYATDQELTAAIEKGLDGLLPLSEKHPKDPRVLEPLFLEFASRATGFADAMATAKRLVEAAPEKRDNESLGLIVKKAAETPGKAADLAFELMKNDLGSTGPDLLYHLAKTSTKVAERARTALKTKEVTALMSPALRIAMDIEDAPSCEARLPLLARAKFLGDLRTSTILTPLARGTKTGCGKWKNRPCPAHCQEQAKEYLDAAQAIQIRASGTTL